MGGWLDVKLKEVLWCNTETIGQAGLLFDIISLLHRCARSSTYTHVRTSLQCVSSMQEV